MHQDGVTALIFASASGHITVVNFLLSKGAEMIFPNTVRHAVCLKYLLRQQKQIAEHFIGADTGVR